MVGPPRPDDPAPAAAEALSALAPNSVVLEGRYRIEREIGRGGMGIVYEATHLMLDRKVAIKMLSPAMRRRPELATRMIREARIVSTIGHPNIVAVTDLGLAEGTPYIVMELLVGVSLEAEISQRGPMGVVEAIAVLEGVLDALDASHRRGVVHRDIKPGNVMLVRDATGRRTVKVLDFGIAKIIDGDQTMTKTAMVLGTPLGMAPEQALGEDVDARADIHAAGSLLYTLLVGEAPFAGTTANVVIARTLDGRFAPASTRAPSVTPAIDAVLERALARQREDRWPDAGSMRMALSACLPGAKPGPRRASAVIAPPAPAEAAMTNVEPPRASSPRGGDPRFAPPPVERLDVHTLIDRPAPRVAPVPTSAASSTTRGLITAAIVIAIAVGGWRWYVMNRGPATAHAAITVDEPELGTPAEEPPPEEPPVDEGEVLLMVTTSPKGAAIFVDDVRATRNPVKLPRSEAKVQVRVEAPGYETKVVDVEPKRSRRVEVKLERLR